MAREWVATCKDCGKNYGYSHGSHESSSRRGMSRPERCPNCRRLHSREISTLGLSHFDLTPVKPVPPTGLKPGHLGGLIRPERVHQVREMESRVDFDQKFGIKDVHIREYFALMKKFQVTVVVAPTGAGKSTFLPYRLMVPPDPFPEDLWTKHGQIIITQPRIQATRGIPAYVSRDLNGSSLGAGYDIGFRHSGSPATDWRNKMVYMTDGTLINMIVRNELGRLSIIMIDEAHERSVNIDLILGLLKAQLPRYPHLRLIIASATIDTGLFSNYFGVPEEAIYEFPGKRKYPVEACYRGDQPIPFTQFSGRMPEEVAKKAFDILYAMETGENTELITMTIDGAPKGPVKGDILAFLHGQKPIERAVASLREMIDEEPRLAGKVDVLPLFTRLPQKEQDKALQPKKNKNRWRVVISTNVAETSLTVEGIVHVIETGLINESQWDPQTQTSFVIPKQHSQAGCKQRWGRAGRLRPGMAHCLYTEEQFTEFPEHTDPEIVRAPIDQIVLTAKAAGVSDVVNFDWIQRPSEAELARAPHYLRQIGALDKDGDLTEHGLELRNFAAEIDIANLMILADRFACTVEMATIIPMINLGGYRAILHWDRSWDAPTKRTVHRIHQGMMVPCQDDVEFYLKLWAAWEDADNQAVYQTEPLNQRKRNDNQSRKVQSPRGKWASRHFVNHNLLKKVESERASLLSSLSGHKKEDSVRPIDFSLLTRLRIVLTYGLSTQIYQLTNDAELEQDPSLDPEYKPYLADPDASPEVKALHEGAFVEIGPESICFDKALLWFVCGKRQRIRFRESPQKEPSTKIMATFLSLIKPNWLQVIGKPPIAVARMIAAETRDDKGNLLLTTTDARVFIDQVYPIGSQFICALTDKDKMVRIGKMHRPAPHLRASSSYEELETSDAIEILDKETELDAFAGIGGELNFTSVVLKEDDDRNLWTSIIDNESEEEPYIESVEMSAIRKRELFAGEIINLNNRVNMPTTQTFVATVAGYDFSDRDRPKVQFTIPIVPDPFKKFVKRYKPGDDILVEVMQVEDFINDWALYLIVREVETQLEIVLDRFDASIIGQNFAIQIFANQKGTQLTVTIEEIDERNRRVRVSRLKASEEATIRLMGREKKRIIEAYVADARENGLYLWLDHNNTYNFSPIGAFVRVDWLIQRPDEMKLGETCKIEVAPKNWRKPIRRTLDNIDNELAATLSKEHLGNHLQWDEVANSLSLSGRISYDQRRKLLGLSNNAQFLRTINTLFRRSNELYIKILDVTGVENIAPLIGQKTTATVVQIANDFVDLEVEGGLQIGVPKHKAEYDRNKDLHDVFKEGEAVDVWVEGVDLENVSAEISLLDPAQDPLNEYQPGQIVHGEVRNIEDFGAFVELSPGAEGMVHVSELAWYRVEKPTDIVHEGQNVKVQILVIKREERRAELTMRLPENDPLRHYRVNQRVYGKVVGFTKDGNAAFVEIEPGADGYLYKDEIGLNRVSNAQDVLQEGQRVHVRITELDFDERKMRVTIRGLYEREIFVPPTHAGMVIGKEGSVIKDIMRDAQAYIDLDDNGYCVVQGLEEKHVEAAINRIQVIIATRIVTFNLDDRQMRMMIGKAGSTINGIQAKTGARIDTERDSLKVIVTADNDYVLQQTLAEIRNAISYYEATVQIPSFRIGRVVGTGGSTIKTIKSATDTWINIAKDNSGRISVEGSNESDVTRAIAMIQGQAGSTTILSTERGTLPSYTEVRSPTPERFEHKSTHQQEPFDYRETSSPIPKVSLQPKNLAPEKPAIYSQAIRVTSVQLNKLQRKQGGFLQTLLGGGKSPLDEIKNSISVRIRVESSTNTIHVTGKTLATVQKAISEIQRKLN